MSAHGYCRLLLRCAHEDAKAIGLKLPRMWAWRTKLCGKTYVQIHDEHAGKIVWEGQGCCCWYGRAKAIFRLVDLADDHRRTA